MSFLRRVTLLLGSLMVLHPAASPAADTDPPASYAAPVARLEAAVNAELERGGMQGVSIALIDDDKIVFARGFGWADREAGVKAGGRKPSAARVRFRNSLPRSRPCNWSRKASSISTRRWRSSIPISKSRTRSTVSRRSRCDN